jgi:hypothetical protein
MPGRDDYILRYLELIRQFLAQAVKLRDGGNLDQALRVLFQAQEKLFARPASEFITRSLDEQLRLLTIGESKENARAKRIGYALLLREAGLIYVQRDRNDLAESAFQLALQIMLIVSVEAPKETEEHRPMIEELLSRVRPEQLHPPVTELLAKLGES